jgi:hypothetical protein
MLVEIEEKRAAAAKAQGRLFARRSLAPLYDTTGTRGLHRQGILSGIPEYPRATFRYEWWERLGVEQGTAYIKIEVNLVTGTRRPWVDLPRC